MSKKATSLPVPQLRVLRALADSEGPLTRTEIAELVGTKTSTMVGRAVGYSDPEKRAAFEQTKDGGGKPGQPCPSLLTLGYVREEELVADTTETVIHITEEGRKIVQNTADVELGPLRD